MVQRLISANASEIKRMSKEELFQSIKASEGRVIFIGKCGSSSIRSGDITCAEMSKAYGADMILLNVFDVNQPIVVVAMKGNILRKHVSLMMRLFIV